MADLFQQLSKAYSPVSASASATSPSSSSAAITTGLALERDDFSIFLHNLLNGSSSSLPTSTSAPLMASSKPKPLPPFSSSPPPPFFSSSIEARSAGESSGFMDGSGTAGAARYPLSFGGVVGSDLMAAAGKRQRAPAAADTDLDELGFDSEGHEAIDVALKSAPPRSSSKRSRAAEVHNLSEKRRRSKINEKMKALQMLIPNSNKTDKASMLDEAIEYLKQLQLQVQMLSMRNGLSLHSVYGPGAMQSMPLTQPGMSFEDGIGLPSSSKELTTKIGSHSAFDIHSHCTPNQPIGISPIAHISNSEGTFCLEPSIPTHYGSFNPSMSSKEVCREDTLQLLQLDMSINGKNTS